MRAPLLFLLVTSACAARPGPRQIVSTYLQAEQAGRYDEAHALLSDTDRKARSLDAYIEEHLSAGPIWLAVARRTTFQVTGQDTPEPGVTRVSVRAVHPDMVAVQQALTDIPIERIETSPDPTAAMFDYVSQTIDARPVPAVTEELSYALREHDAGWRVWLGLDRQDAAVEALKAAREARAEGDADKALAALRRLLEVQPDPGGVVAMVQRVAGEEFGELPAATP